MSFISRLPERYGLAEELKQAAWEDESWETVGPLFDEPGGRIYRFLAVHSSALETKKAQTLEKKRSLERIRILPSEKAAGLWAMANLL